MGSFGAVLACVIFLTAMSVISDSGDERIMEQREKSEKMAHLAVELAEHGIPPQGGASVFQNDPLYSGEQILRQHCLACHSFEGSGGNSAPDLTAYNTKPWLVGFFADPNAPKYYGKTDIDIMPEYDLEEEELSDLVDFLLAQSENGKEIDSELKETGEMLLEENGCYNCHTFDGTGGDTAPVLDNFGSDEWLRGLIEDPGKKEYFGQLNTMPAFKDKLSKREIDNLVFFLQNKRKNPIQD